MELFWRFCPEGGEGIVFLSLSRMLWLFLVLDWLDSFSGVDDELGVGPRPQLHRRPESGRVVQLFNPKIRRQTRFGRERQKKGGQKGQTEQVRHLLAYLLWTVHLPYEHEYQSQFKGIVL